MARPLNTIPRGFLDLLGLKTGGVNPLSLAEDLRPTVEIGDLYKMSRVEVTGAGVGTLVNAGDFAELNVPDNEVWFVHALSGTAGTSLAAGDTLQISIGTDQQGGSIIVAQSPVTVLTSASQQVRASTSFVTPPFILVPGDSIFMQVDVAVVAVAPSFSGNIRARVSRFGPNTEILTA